MQSTSVHLTDRASVQLMVSEPRLKDNSTQSEMYSSLEGDGRVMAKKV